MPIATQPNTAKTCQTCGEEKPLSDFSGCGITADRLQPNCKPCHEERKLAGKAAANVKRMNKAPETPAVEQAGEPQEPVVETSPAATAQADAPLQVPYPEADSMPREQDDEQTIAKKLANMAARELAGCRDPEMREGLRAVIREESAIAEMNDQDLLARKRHRANPVNRLTYEEKIHCIRTLPLAIVHKLFPNI